MISAKNPILTLFPLWVFFLMGCEATSQNASGTQADAQPEVSKVKFASLPDAETTRNLKTATLAGGCFWCTEAVFERVKGVEIVIAGYAGGTQDRPTYEQVSRGQTDHAESIQIYYRPEVVSYGELLDIFFGSAHDPTQVDRQGADVGRHYRSIAFYRNEAEREEIVRKSEQWAETWGKALATETTPFEKFHPAEEYHQDYHPRNPNNPYIRAVSQPKVEKLGKMFPRLLKEEFR